MTSLVPGQSHTWFISSFTPCLGPAPPNNLIYREKEPAPSMESASWGPQAQTSRLRWGHGFVPVTACGQRTLLLLPKTTISAGKGSLVEVNNSSKTQSRSHVVWIPHPAGGLWKSQEPGPHKLAAPHSCQGIFRRWRPGNWS